MGSEYTILADRGLAALALKQSAKKETGFHRNPLLLGRNAGRNPLAEPRFDETRERGLRKRGRKPRKR